jgi:putative ABC transport system substrate-binding protein
MFRLKRWRGQAGAQDDAGATMSRRRVKTQVRPLPECAGYPPRMRDVTNLRRRDLLMAASALLAAPRSVRTQPARPYRVSLVFTTTHVSEMAAPAPLHPGARMFLDTLRGAGYVDTRNLIYEPRSAEGKYDRYEEIFAELVALRTDVIVTIGDDMTRKAREATSTIPIVMAYSNAPVEAGLVQSLAHPGGNVTGITTNPTPQLEAKRLQLLQEALPHIARVAFLGLRSEWEDVLGQGVRAAAPKLGLRLHLAESAPNDYTSVFASMTRDRPDAVFVANSPVNFGHRNMIVGLVNKARLPAIYHAQEFVLAGGLMSYGTNVPELFRHAALIVVRLLKGTKPSDVPVEQPTKFEMAINLRTARELGLTIPQPLLLRADRVVE